MKLNGGSRMRKLIFFDIDGTLTSAKEHGKIYDSTREAIRRLEENGHFVALATGRAAFRAKVFQEEIGIKNMVCEGGNEVVINNETISYEPLDQRLMNSIYQDAIKNNIGVAVSLEDSRIRYTPNPTFIDNAGDYGDFMEVRLKEDFQINDAIIRRLFLTLRDGDEKRIPALSKMGYMHYGKDYFTIIEADDKYRGIKKIVEYFHEDENNVVVFGDGLNDRKMFKDAPFAIAMGNAIDELKELADYVCEDADHDGILKACEHFGWI